MTKSLPLIALALFAGLATSAQAATPALRSHTPNAGTGTFAVALGFDHSLLSALDNLLTDNRQAADVSARDCDCRPQAPSADRPSETLSPPGPATTVSMPITGNPLIDSDSAAADRDAPANTDDPHAPAGNRPDLGWQSLLPGSIQ